MTSLNHIDTNGFAIVQGLFKGEEVDALIAQVPPLDSAAGTRSLLDFDWCKWLAADARVTDLVHQAVGNRAIPVRGILFDKSAAVNWNLGWHQDTKIAVRKQIDTEGYSAWSNKEGVVHCMPPAKVLESSVAVRIHLDDCDQDNGPLKVIPGSHLSGIQTSLPEDLVANSFECLVDRGGVILMKPLLWHASSKANTPRHRRVIHIEYCAEPLQGGLQWAYSSTFAANL